MAAIWRRPRPVCPRRGPIALAAQHQDLNIRFSPTAANPLPGALVVGSNDACWPTLTLLIVMSGFCFSNAVTSAFQSASRSFWEPSGWQSTVMTVLPLASVPESLPFVEHAARLNPRPAASASAATFRYCGTDICPSLRGTNLSMNFTDLRCRHGAIPGPPPRGSVSGVTVTRPSYFGKVSTVL